MPKSEVKNKVSANQGQRLTINFVPGFEERKKERPPLPPPEKSKQINETRRANAQMIHIRHTSRTSQSFPLHNQP